MDYLELAHQLRRAGEPFALATVVGCTPPASARPGAKALIRADGSLQGWVGGSCAQPLVVREAVEALRDGRARLVRLSPTAVAGGRRRPDVVEYLMTCHSGGTLEIFIEPVLPAPQLWVVGGAPVCQALAAMGRLLGYEVVSVDPDPHAAPVAETDVALRTFEPGRVRPGRAYVVVATMGTADEEMLEAALRSEAGHVALVASRRRAATLRDYLAGRGVSAEQLDRLKAPAGLDIGAETPQEIALSIMAEITQARSRTSAEARQPRAEAAPAEAREPAARQPRADVAPAEARDPVCGMGVSVADARFAAEHAGTSYYFCCAHCLTTFEAEPERFVSAAV